MSVLSDALAELPDAVFADLLESEEAYLVVIDVPGATGQTVEVSLRGPTLHVEARRDKPVPEGFEYVSEDRDLYLELELPVPPDATGENATATVDQGVLELRLPKASDEEKTTIPVEDG